MILLHFLPLRDLPGERNPCWKSSCKQTSAVPRALIPRSLQGISTDFLSPNIGVKSRILPSKDRSRPSLCPILLLWLRFVFQAGVATGLRLPRRCADRSGISWARRGFVAASTAGPPPWSPLQLLRHNFG